MLELAHVVRGDVEPGTRFRIVKVDSVVGFFEIVQSRLLLRVEMRGGVPLDADGRGVVLDSSALPYRLRVGGLKGFEWKGSKVLPVAAKDMKRVPGPVHCRKIKPGEWPNTRSALGVSLVQGEGPAVVEADSICSLSRLIAPAGDLRVSGGSSGRPLRVSGRGFDAVLFRDGASVFDFGND